MAQQFHMAFSSEVSGAGIVAGGPFFCAKGNLVDALNRCMKTVLGAPSSQASADEAKKLSDKGMIDPLHNLENDKVWSISGTKDETVFQKVADSMIESYKIMGVPAANIQYLNKIAIGHAFPTENFGNSCSTPSQSPYVSKCNLDGAGEILNHVIGKLHPKTVFVKENLYQFDQLKFADRDVLDKLSMHQTAYVYVPEGCEDPDRNGCHVHVAFHGCQQTLDDIKTTFVVSTGYNEWAESNKIVVVYPQAKKSQIGNPNGCWDWWGYSSNEYHTKNAPQMKVVMKTVAALKSGNLDLKKSE